MRCGTLPGMPDSNSIDFAEAQAAVKNGERVRAHHRKRSERGSQQRSDDIKLALARIQDAMKPVRSEIGRFPHGPQTDAAEERRKLIRAVSQQLQRERRKLWKMR